MRALRPNGEPRLALIVNITTSPFSARPMPRGPLQFGQMSGHSIVGGVEALRRGLAGDDKVDRFRALALLVGFDFERNALPLIERLQTGPLDRRDVHEDIATTVI